MVDKLHITPSKESKSDLKLQELKKYLKIIPKFKPLIDTVVISKIEMPETTASLQYSTKEGGKFAFTYKNDINATAAFNITQNNYIVNIKALNINDFKSKLKGTLILDTKKMKMYTKLNAVINNDANLTLFALNDNKKLHFNVSAADEIHRVKAILNMIPFYGKIKYWANDAIEAKSLQLYALHGSIDFNDIKNSYKHIYVNAAAKQIKYKYNPKLAAIESKQTLLEFKDGTLYIKPLQAYTYNTYLKTSWLKIDFTPKHEHLDLYLKLNGQVNDDILHLLSVYKIKLPFKQNSGIVKSNLHLNINLRTIKTDVTGDFWLKKANMDYIGLNLNIFNTHVHLHNTDVTIDKMRATYKDILDTNVTMHYNVKQSLGNINFDANKVAFKGVTLYTKAKPFHVLYHLSKEKNLLRIDSSQWSYKKIKILFNSFIIPFDIGQKTLVFPPVMCNFNNIAKAFISGQIDLKTLETKLDTDIFELNYKGVRLAQTDAYFKVLYQKDLHINTQNSLKLQLNGTAYTIKDFQLLLKGSNLTLKRTSIEIGKFIQTKINAKYHLGSRKVNIGLNDFILKTPKSSQILYKNNKIRMQAFFTDKNITIKSPQLNAEFYSNKQEWKLDLNSLDRIAKHAQILKLLNLSRGEVHLYKNSSQPQTKFNAQLISPYALLMHKNSEIHNYTIEGEIKKDKRISFLVNNQVKVKIADVIKIYPKNVSINLHDVIALVKKIQTIPQNKKKDKEEIKLYLNATNSMLYLGKDRYVISDKIYLQYVNGIITAQLLHKHGKAGFRMTGNKFYLYGQNFNDRFMENFSAFSKFKGGRLDFSMQGHLDDYSGVFFVSNTTIVDYKLLNNILAFVNTVPSLVTFSLPNYNKEGLFVKNAYLNFSSKSEVFHISDFYLNSKELTIAGKGDADIVKDKINILLNLKTDLGRNVSKIPLVGYIIFDGKTISTTLKVTGKLSDPKVETQLAKDIVVAPLNIIKRTLTLPYKLIKKSAEDAKITNF